MRRPIGNQEVPRLKFEEDAVGEDSSGPLESENLEYGR